MSIAVENAVAEAGTDGASEVVAVRPIGPVEFIRWYERELHDADGNATPKTINELVAAYPGKITKGSFQAKLSKIRTWAAKKNLRLSSPKRAGRTGGVNEADIDALAAELNLSRLVDETDEDAE